MSYSKTWTFSMNNRATDNTSITTTSKSYVLQLITFLTANGWTADGSSNGTATSTTTNISTITDLVAAAAGTAHSWQILKSPVGVVAGLNGTYTGAQSQIWLLISMDNANAYSILMEGFSQKPTGGTITANPVNATYALGFNNGQVLNSAANKNPLFHFAVTSQGHFWTGITYPSTNYMAFFMSLLPTINPAQVVGLDYPYATGLVVSYAISASNPLPFLTATLKTWGIDGIPNTSSTLMAISTWVSGVFVGVTNTGGLNRDGKLDTSIGLIYCYTGSVGVIAEIADFTFTGASSFNKIVDNLTVTKCLYGCTFMPTNAVPIS